MNSVVARHSALDARQFVSGGQVFAQNSEDHLAHELLPHGKLAIFRQPESHSLQPRRLIFNHYRQITQSGRIRHALNPTALSYVTPLKSDTSPHPSLRHRLYSGRVKLLQIPLAVALVPSLIAGSLDQPVPDRPFTKEEIEHFPGSVRELLRKRGGALHEDHAEGRDPNSRTGVASNRPFPRDPRWPQMPESRVVEYRRY